MAKLLQWALKFTVWKCAAPKVHGIKVTCKSKAHGFPKVCWQQSPPSCDLRHSVLLRRSSFAPSSCLHFLALCFNSPSCYLLFSSLQALTPSLPLLALWKKHFSSCYNFLCTYSLSSCSLTQYVQIAPSSSFSILFHSSLIITHHHMKMMGEC